jgi:hypothetical protein
MFSTTKRTTPYHESHFEQYIESVEKLDIHPELAEYRAQLASRFVREKMLLLLYGPSGVGKYSQMLAIIAPLSPTRLKHERNVILENDKQTYILRVSDIHYEIDMALLGCYSKLLFHDFFGQVTDIIAMSPQKKGILVCLNVHAIHAELLDVLYSYIQEAEVLASSGIQVSFILITEHLGFLPRSIYESFEIVQIRRPSKDLYEKMTAMHSNPTMALAASAAWQQMDTDDVQNIKETYALANNPELFNLCGDAILRKLFTDMTGLKKSDFGEIRECLYDCLVYNLEFSELLWYIIYNIGRMRLQKNNHLLFQSLIEPIQYYNNNYRPIYHMEHIFYKLYLSINKTKG